MDPMSAIGAGTGLVGGILNIFGRRRQRNEGVREDTRLEQETRRRAQAKAALMKGLLQSSGYGGVMSDDQMVDFLTRTPRRGGSAGGVLQDVGGLMGNVGGQMVLGAEGSPGSDTRSASFWEFLDELMGQRGTGGAPPQPARDGVGLPTRA